MKFLNGELILDFISGILEVLTKMVDNAIIDLENKEHDTNKQIQKLAERRTSLQDKRRRGNALYQNLSVTKDIAGE